MNVEQKIGKVPGEDDGRDAVHVAIADVVAGCGLAPGEQVGLSNGVINKTMGADGCEPVTVDRLLEALAVLLKAGTMGYTFMAPNTTVNRSPNPNMWCITASMQK